MPASPVWASTAVATNEALTLGEVSWSSSDATKATISLGGLATAAAYGTTTITATNGTISGSTTLTVASPDTGVSVSSGNLIITDGNGGTNNDTLTISLVSGNIRVNDPGNALSCSAPAIQVNANTCDVAVGDVTGNIQVDTQGGNDTLTLDLGSGDFIPTAGLSFAGGDPTTGPGDELVITGGAQGTVTYNYTNANDGNIVMSNFGTVSYTGLEPISNTGTGTDMIFNMPAASSHVATLSDLGSGNSRLSSTGPTFEQTDFTNPSGSVTINGGDLNDVIGVNALATNYPSLTINGGQGTDSVNINGNITFATNASLDVNLQNDHATPGTDAVMVNAAQVIVSGTGTIDIRASEDVIVNFGGRLQTQNGTLTIEANQQLVPTSSDNNGIDIDSGTIESTGSGNISIKGTGGEGDFDQNTGVYIFNGGTVNSSGTGTITVQGTGGAFSGTVNSGLQNSGITVEGTGSQIISSSGAMQITGTGGTGAGTAAAGLYGVYLTDEGTIQANGAGTLTINGTGGSVASGGSTAVNSAGIIMDSDGTIASTGSGASAAAINITANANAAGAGSSQGFRLDSPATITTVDGVLSINATAGSCSLLCLGFSIRGNITASGTGAINLDGTGGTGGTSNIGANVRTNGEVSVMNGNLTVTGTGGTGSDNLGVTLGNSGAGTLRSLGTGTVTIKADSMNIAAGGVINTAANTASLRQKTNGVAINLGSGVDTTASTLELSDAELDRVTAGTLNVGDANSGAITVSSDISRPAGNFFNLFSGANIDVAGGALDTNGGDMTLVPGTNVFPSHSGVDVTTAPTKTVGISTGKDLKIVINNTTVDTGYTQLNVAGLLNIIGVNLVLSGTHTPVAGQTFTIVNNDSADTIAGTFAGLPEGATIPNFLGSAFGATITYLGGTNGNDVVLTVVAADVSVAVSPSSVPEDGATNLGYTFTRTVNSTGALTVDFAVGGTATFGTDYTQTGAATFGATSGTVTFTGTNTTAVVTIDPAVDTDYEANETVLLTLTSGSGYNVGTPNSATGTITNDDSPPATLVVNTTNDVDDTLCDATHCSLREAINAANFATDASTINFNIPTGDSGFSGGVYTIQPATGLPVIANGRPATIDGTSQTAISNSNPDGPEIMLDGSLTSGSSGLRLQASNSTVKGFVINGFETGISMGSFNTANNQILDNYVGTNASGTAAVPNGGGVGVGTTTGSTISGNLISGNSVGISTCDASNSTFSNNKIGTDRTGALNLGNGVGAGIHFQCSTGSNNTITGNTIAFNGTDGFRDEPDYRFGPTPHANNRLTQNSIFSNGGLGINLLPPPFGTVDGVTPNDSMDPDTGGNNLQNFPVLTSAKVTGTTYRVTGTLNTTVSSASGYTIEFFSNPVCDADTSGASSGTHGEGKTYLGSVITGNTDASGNVAFTFYSTTAFSVGDVITATAADVNGNTSEFSACFTAIAGTPGTIQFSAVNYNDAEQHSGTHTATITVQRTGGSDGPASIHYATSDGVTNWATAGSDYDSASGDFNWADGDGSDRTFTVTVHGDTTVEANEIVDLTLSAATGASIGGTNPATLTIVNDDSDVSVAVSPGSVAENGGNLVYTFARNGATASALTVNFSVSGTAVFSSDYGQSGAATFTASSGTVTIDAGNPSAAVTIDPTDDGTYEANETVVLTVIAGSGYNVGSPSSATGTITNDDAIPLSLVVTKTDDTNDGFCTLDDCSLREAISNANVISDTNSITFAIPAATDAGCNSLTGLCTIKPSSPLPSVSTPVNINGYTQTGASANTLAVGNDAALKIVLDGTNAGSTAIGLEFSATLSSVRGLVINRFGLDGIRLTGNTNNVVAGNFIGTDVTGTAAAGNGAHGVHLSGASTNTIGGTTAADRNVISGGTSSGSQGIQIAGTPITGNVVKGNYIGTNAAGTAAIPNGSDGVRIISSSNTVIGGATALEANVVAGNGLDGIRVNGDGTIIKGNFIGTNSAGAVLGNGQAGIHTVNANNNVIGGTAAGEGNTVANNGIKGVYIQSATGNVIRSNSIYSNTGLGIDLGLDSVTANDDDDIDTGANNLQNFPVITAVVVGAPNTISGTLDSTPSQTFTIDFYSNPAGSCDPTGNGEGRTYLGSKSTTTDANGLGAFRFNPATLNANDVITATATDSAGNTSEFSACVSAATVDFGDIKFAQANTDDTETNAGTHTVNIVVQRVNGADRAVSVTYTITDGTAQDDNPGTEDNDYSVTLATGTLSWANGDSSNRNIPITVNGDTKFEPDETVNITLSNPTGGAAITGPTAATLTIKNDDARPTISINDVAQNEGDSGITSHVFTVSLSNPSSETVTVDFASAVSLTNPATVGTCGTPGVDYQAQLNTLTFTPGDTEESISMQVCGDTTHEQNEQFVINLTNATNSTGITDAQGLGTITNDDPVPAISISNATPQNEGNFHGVDNDIPDETTHTFTVSLFNPSDQTITVDYATANGTTNPATAPSDYTAVTITTLTFNPGETTKPVTVIVKGDTTYELDETFFVNLSNASANATINDGQGLGTILNDDAMPAFSINDRSNNEGTMPVPLPSPTPLQYTTQTFTVTKTGSTAVTATVSFDTADGSATGNAAPCPSGFDYEAQSGSLSFAANETTKTITVRVCKDPTFEGNETFFVNLSAPTHATVTDAQGQGTILNDDIPGSGFVVNTTNDVDDTVCDGTHCSLREAIIAANGSSSAVAINFAIPDGDLRHFYYQDDGAGTPNGQVTLANVTPTSVPGVPDPDWPHSWWSILPTSQLPSTTKQVFIDGYTQTGAVANASITTANNAVLRIELNGASAGLNATGLTISGGTSTVRGLVINRFQRDGSAPTPAGNGLSLPSGNNTVAGNFIGTDVSGTLDVGTLAGLATGNGISTTSFNNVIGGNTPDVVNLIAANDLDGISFSNSNTNVIRGNLIGTKANGVGALGNGGSGISFTGLGSVANTVGGAGAGEGNTIAFNSGDGLNLSTANFGNSIRGNSIFSNGTTALHLGIDLGTDGVTPNDNLDADTGPNNLQNFPIITAAMVTGSTRTITGTLNSSAGDTFVIDFYQSPACAPACGIGEGKTYLGSTSVTTDGTTGDVTFTFHPSVLTIGQFVTATATSTGGIETSEFSARTLIADGSPGAGDIQFTDATYTVGEAGVTASITVKRVGGSNGSVSTTFSTVSGGTATAGSDYTTVTNQAITYVEGETADKTVTVTIANDGVYETNETVFLSLGGTVINARKDGQLAQVDPHSAVLTITDNDTPPSFAINDVTMVEGNSGTTSFVFTVTKTGSTQVNASVDYSTAPGTATSPSDFTAISATTLQFLPADVTKQFTVFVNGDTAVEHPSESFSANLSNPTNATITDGIGLGTITNDDADVSVAVSPAAVAEDGATNLVYTFTRTGATAGALTVNYSLSGAAGPFSDYTLPGAATFAAGSSTTTVTVDPLADVTVESDETVIVTLTAGTGYNVVSPSSATGTITNDDTDVTVAVAPAAVAEDGVPNLVYTFTRNGVTSGSLTVIFSVTGSATFSTDYTQTGANTYNAANGSVTFSPGNSTAAITIDPTTDSAVESDETVTLTLTSLSGYNIGTPASATGTITNDEGDVTLSVSPLSVTEDGVPNLVYTFTRNAATTTALTVNFSVAGTAAFSTDYTQTGAASFNASSGTVTFGAGNSTAAVTINPTTDLIFESDETVILTVASGTGYNVSSPNSATGTILNDDATGGIVRFSSATYNTTENSRFVTITVERVGDTSGAITVDYATPDDSEATTFVPCSTVNGSASPRCDFTTALGTLRFAAGETSKTFIVLISQDNYVEGPESLALTLSNLTGGAVFGAPSSSTITIADDLSEPTANPIDDAENFVRQHYHDFLNREPDASGLAFWRDQILACGTDAACIENRRIHVSAAFYLSIEFQGTGYLVERLYKSSYGDVDGSSTIGGAHTLKVPIVRFSEFLLDTQEIGQGVIVGQPGWEAALENNKAAFAARFVQRSRFLADYPLSMTPAAFVDQLNTRAGNPLSPAERNQLVTDLSTSAKTRAQVLRAVAEDPDLVSAEFNRAFVLMQYFGYLRRNPDRAPDSDHSGYDFWLTKLNQFNGNFVNAEMVKAFIVSIEYRRRSAQ